MTQAQVKTLFRKFAAPLASYAATSLERKRLAVMLARNFWAAMIAGPELEESTWEVLKTTAHLDDESLEAIQRLYFDEMKPAVSEEQLLALRRRYRLQKKA